MAAPLAGIRVLEVANWLAAPAAAALLADLGADVIKVEPPGGPELMRRLAARSDMLLTNLIQQRRVRYGLTWEEVRAASA